MNRLLLTLRYFGSGSFLNSIAEFGGVSLSSASRIIGQVSETIARLLPKFIQFPTNLTDVKIGFYKTSKFPRVIGVINSTRVQIKSPGGDIAEYHIDSEGRSTVHIQTVTGPNLQILDVVARWPGAFEAQFIFDNSKLSKKLSDKEFGNVFVLGDQRYKNTEFLLTPLENAVAQSERLYNEAHAQVLSMGERALAVWKARFPLLSHEGRITVSYNKVQAIIVACAVLHNMAIEAGEEHFEVDSSESGTSLEEVVPQSTPEGVMCRNNLVKEYFWSLKNIEKS